MAFVRSLSNSRGTWNGGVRSGFLRAHCPLHLFGVQTAPKNAHTLRRSFCLACRPEAAHTRHTAVPAPAVGVCNGRRGPMPRIAGGCGPCVRPKVARPRWFAHSTSVSTRLKTMVYQGPRGELTRGAYEAVWRGSTGWPSCSRRLDFALTALRA